MNVHEALHDWTLRERSEIRLTHVRPLSRPLVTGRADRLGGL